jgi:hypothetical protein
MRIPVLVNVEFELDAPVAKPVRLGEAHTGQGRRGRAPRPDAL